MNFSKVKLVVTDMDGTLLNSNHEVSDKFLHQFEALKTRNIHFVAASGRQYQSILGKLSSIKEDISVIAENGAVMQFKDKTQVLLQLNASEISKCVDVLRTVKDCFIVLCGRNSAYVETKDTEFLEKLYQYYAEVKIVDDLTQVTDDAFVKIAVFHFESSEANVYPSLNSIVDHFQVIISGQNWLDISHPEANKSFALKQIQKELNITPEETMVFGDYNNDIEMLKLAKFSYAMANAHPRVKEVANYNTLSNDANGVEAVLEKVLSSQK
jgi:Cof subfamily protein (haloacid dehalogenase superfamily)